MSRKSESSNFRNKFSTFFGSQRGAASNRTPPEEFNLDNDTLNELRKGHLANRMKILKHLSEKVEEKRLDKDCIESLWVAIQDVAKDGPVAERHNVIGFLCSLVSNQYSQLGAMRQTLFQYVKSCNMDDLDPCFNLLVSLTQEGSDIHLIEEQIGEYMIQLVPLMITKQKMLELLMFLGNMTKMNATYIDNELLMCVFNECCQCKVKQPIEEIRACIIYIEVAVQYAIIPPSAIQCLMIYICSVRFVIPPSDSCSQVLEKVMKMLITNRSLKHNIIYTLCSFLEDQPPASFVAPPVIQRSTMYLLSKTLWNRSRAQPKQHFCCSVLSSVLKVIKGRCKDVIVEVLQGLEFYVRNHRDVMEHLTWDAMLRILREIVLQQRESKFSDVTIREHLNNILNEGERMYTEQGYYKCKDGFYEIIELCVDIRPTNSMNNLMTQKERLILPGVLHWCDNLLQFMLDFYNRTRPEEIRLTALERFWGVVDQFYTLYEEELLAVVLRVLDSVHTDRNTKVRHRAVLFLNHLCPRCNSEKFYHIINIILKVISVVVQDDDENESIHVCRELIKLFQQKVSRTPSRHALYIFEGLVKLASSFYSPHFTPHFSSTARIRYMILEALYGISMAPSGEAVVYIPNEGGPGPRIVTSSFLRISVSDICIRPQQVIKLELELPKDETEVYGILPLPYDHIDNLIYHCLNRENDWLVLELTLAAIKRRLSNAQLQTSTNLDFLTSKLASLLSNKDWQHELTNVRKDCLAVDIKASIYPVLVRLIPYQARKFRTSGDASLSRKLLDALIEGLLPKFAKVCIEGLTLATLEMSTLIIRRLSNIIINISRIPASRHLAISTLSFLSCLAHSPALYKNFNEKEYKMVIGVILPYTDPVKFEVFTIHFAHVVVCSWYVRCHYKHRPAFKEFILSQLRSMAESAKPRADSTHSTNHDCRPERRINSSVEARETWSLRPRSGDYGRLSLSGQSTPRSSFKRTPPTTINSDVQESNEKTAAHNQLIECTEDLLERWMFSGRCNIVKRSPQLDILFLNKKTKTWVVGHTLITISTSLSCDRPSPEACERCRMVQALMGESSFSGSSDDSHESGHIIPIPGTAAFMSNIADFSKIQTPKCACWCKNFAHVEIRSPTSTNSIILRLQNKCHFVGLDSATGGDSHVITSLFDDDLSQLLVRDVESDYSPQQLENILSSSSTKKHLPRRRRNSTPKADEMTPTAAIEVRQRSHSDLGVTEKSDPLRQQAVDLVETNFVDICERYADRQDAEREAVGGVVDGVFTQNGCSKNAEKEIPRVRSEGELANTRNARDSKSQDSSPFSSPRHSLRKTERTKSPANSLFSDSSQDLAASSSLKDGSRFSVDSDQSHNDIDPAFIFRQLYPLISSSSSADSIPVHLPDTADLARGLKIIDHIMVYNTHKIGVIYVGPGQTNEVVILRNTYGSVRYVEFLQDLGDMIWLANCDQGNVYVGSLDTSGHDGDYTISWRDKTSQIVFHVATLMPQHDTDPTSTNKKRHIGNNFVTIVYNDSGLPYQQGTIRGQCNSCDIVIEPRTEGMNLITFISLTKTVLSDLKPHGTLLVSDKPLATVVRQLAVNANSLCQVMRGSGTAYSCNWLERLKKIKKLVHRSVTPLSSPTSARRETLH